MTSGELRRLVVANEPGKRKGWTLADVLTVAQKVRALEREHCALTVDALAMKVTQEGGGGNDANLLKIASRKIREGL